MFLQPGKTTMTKNGSSDELPLATGDVEEWVELDLVPEKRPVKGTAEFSVPQLKGWLALGKPVIRTLPTPVNSELASYEFRHVLLAASFRPEEGTPFDRVWVQVDLDTESPAEAIAWSMHPRRETNRIDITRTVGVNATLGLKWLSSEGKSEQEQKFTGLQPFLIAYNELCVNPVWEFVDTEQVPIMGSQRLHLIVRKTPIISVRGRVSVTATVKHKRFGLFTCKSRVEDAPSLSFLIP
jgi:hypothetical protein